MLMNLLQERAVIVRLNRCAWLLYLLQRGDLPNALCLACTFLGKTKTGNSRSLLGKLFLGKSKFWLLRVGLNLSIKIVTWVGFCWNQHQPSNLFCLLGIQIRTIVTWLILPVVICLSQRLSHACLSINKFILWNCEWLIKSVIVYLIVTYYLDNRGNSAANTCIKSRLLEGMYLLDLSQPGQPV